MGMGTLLAVISSLSPCGMGVGVLLWVGVWVGGLETSEANHNYLFLKLNIFRGIQNIVKIFFY